MARISALAISDTQESQMADFARMRRDPSFFILGEGPKHFCLTFDELAGRKEIPFPRFYYLLFAIHVLNRERFVAMEKSRQMMYTWLLCAYALWTAMFRDSQVVGIQSLREEMSKFHLRNKVLYMYRCLPPWLRYQCPIEPTQKEIVFPKTNSKIIAFQQGADALRGYTISLFINDEVQSQDLAEEAFGTALPTMIGSGAKQGRCAAVGTAMDGTYYKRLVQPDEGVYRNISRGVSVKRNATNNFFVLRTHYSADPNKNADWVRLNRPLMGENKWAREMEIDWNAAAGNPYFPEFQPLLMKRTDLRPIPGLPLLRGWDYGRLSPACVVEQYNPIARQVAALKEFTMPGSNIWEFADKVTSYCKNYFGGYDFLDYGDVAGNQMSDTSDLTSAQVLSSPPYNIPVMSSRAPKSLGFDIFRKWLLMTPDRREPGFIVDIDGCPILANGLDGGFVYVETKGVVNDEAYVKKHPITDIFDAHKYIFLNDWQLRQIDGAYPVAEPEPDPARMSVDEYKDWYMDKLIKGEFGEETDYSHDMMEGANYGMVL